MIGPLVPALSCPTCDWALGAQVFSPNLAMRAERISDSAFSEPDSPEVQLEPKFAKMEQRDSDVADDWDVSSDEDEATDEATPIS